MVQYTSQHTLKEQEEIKKKLLKIGVLNVEKENLIAKVIKNSEIKSNQLNIEDSIEKFVMNVSKKISNKKLGKEWQTILQDEIEIKKLIQIGNFFFLKLFMILR